MIPGIIASSRRTATSPINLATPLLPPDNAGGATCWFGMYSAPTDGTWTNPTNVDRTDWFLDREALVRPSPADPDTVDVGIQFYGWGDDLRGPDATSIDLTQWHHDGGRIPMVTWQPGSTPGGMEAIRAGTHDTYIKQRFTELKNLGFPVMLRFAHEMNGEWYDWNPWHKDDQTHAYTNAAETRTEMWRWREAWRRVWRLCRNPASGQPSGEPAGVAADNVVFIWCPGTGSVPTTGGTPNNDKWEFYPGDQYVDWIGLDGYGQNSETWAYNWDAPIADVASAHTARDHAGDKPLIICETSSHANAYRVPYIEDAAAALAAHPYVKGFCWFDQNKSDGDWAVDSVSDSGEALDAIVDMATSLAFSPRT